MICRTIWRSRGVTSNERQAAMGSMLAPCRLKRIVEDALHGLRVVQARAGLGGGEAGVRREARIGVISRIKGWPSRSTRKSTRCNPRSPNTVQTATCQFRQPGQESGIRFGKSIAGRVPQTRRNRRPIWHGSRRSVACRAGRLQSRSRPAGRTWGRGGRPDREVELRGVHDCSAKHGLAPSRLGRANPLGQLSTVAAGDDGCIVHVDRGCS